MMKLLLLAYLTCAADPALAQAVAPLPLRPVPLQLPPVAELRLPWRLGNHPGERFISCPVLTVTNTSDDPFYPCVNLQPILSRAAGVQVTPNSGAPGDWATVRMRGSGLRGADQPLYVIDGLPALNADFAPVQSAPQPMYGWGQGPQVSAAGANPLLFVVPQDINNVTVLRGAVATAEYGSQGANGVILITTKRGGKKDALQAPRLRYENSTGVQQVRQRLRLLDARQYADLANEVWRNAGSVGQPPVGAATLAGLGAGTDWQHTLFGAALLQQHFVSLDGSTARLRYAASANYLGQNGVVLDSRLRRYGLRLNLDYTLAPSWRAQLNVAGAVLTRTLPPAGTVPTALLAPPTVPAYTGDAPTVTSGFNLGGPGYAGSFFNPVALARQAATTDDTRRLLVQAGTTYQASAALRLEAQLSHEHATVQATNRTLLVGITNPTAAPTATDLARTTQHLATTNARLALSYAPLRTGRHQLTTQANVQGQYLGRSQEQVLLALSTGSFRQDYSLGVLSTWVSAAYTFAGQLQLTAVARADRGKAAQYALGTNGWQLYPGAEVRWDVGKAGFMQGQQAVSSLRLNLALSQCSNTSIAATSFPAGPTSVPVTSLISANDQPLIPRTTQLNTGLAVGLFGGHLNVEPTFYSHYTRHANVAQAMPVGLDYGTLLVTRDVDVRNRGLELAVRGYWRLLHQRLTGQSSLAASYNQQTVVSVAGEATAGPVPGVAVGEPLHPFYGYQRLGIGASGNVQYRDTNSDGTVTFADAGYFGTGIPPYLLDFSQTLTYGRFTLQAQFDGLFGYQLLSPTLAVLDQPTGSYNGSTRLLDRWTPTHPSADVPQASYDRPQLYDDHTPQSAANFRLSLLTLSCRLLKPESQHQLQAWVGSQNLFVLTSYRGFDPNVSSGGGLGQLVGYDGSTYPVARTWLAGVRATL